MEFPPRTNLTSLTDNELLLFDFLFDWKVSRKALYRENYSDHMNCPYNHTLSDPEVDQVLSRMESEGLVESGYWVPQHGLGYSLTAAGGDLWEQERNPDWEYYCCDCGYEEDGIEWLEIKCASRDVGERFLRTWDCARLAELDLNHIELKQHRQNDFIVYWKKQPDVFVLRCQSRPGNDFGDWEIYEAHRKWWRTIDELVNLKL